MGKGLRGVQMSDLMSFQLSSRRLGSQGRAKVKSSMRAFTYLAPALMCGAFFAFAAPANAAQPTADPAYSALLDFAQKVGIGQPTLASAVQPATQVSKQTKSDAAYDALRAFARDLGSARTTDKPIRLAAAKAMPTKAKKEVMAVPVGSAKCRTCHAQQAAEFDKTLMGKINKTAKGKGKFECENCHGPGSEHVRLGGGRGVGGILSFEKDDPRTVEERNSVCLACHERGERTYWAGSIHETRGLACTNCHTVMSNVSRKHNLKTRIVAETCYQCHKLKRAQMQYSSHMPVRENKITCTDCHNPHGSAGEKLIREASVNENCYKCHAEKRGPFLFEHEPVRESCLNCHKPHGSNYEYLLKVARPRLCHECHSFAHGTGGFSAASPGSVYVMGRGCGNCHSQIHGSNHPGGAFFLR
jgi:DmsE family decaheme c-type cytochrome